MKSGAARGETAAPWRLLDVAVAEKDATFAFTLNRDNLRKVRRCERRYLLRAILYLLRTNLCDEDPANLRTIYIQRVVNEAAFDNLKRDRRLHPIYHQVQDRIDAHSFVAFVAYCPHVTLRARLKHLSRGLPRPAAPDKLTAIQHARHRFPNHRWRHSHPALLYPILRIGQYANGSSSGAVPASSSEMPSGLTLRTMPSVVPLTD